MAGRRGGIRPLPESAYAEFRRRNDPAQAAASRGPAQPHLPREPRQPRRRGQVAGARGASGRRVRARALAGWVALIRAGGSADPAEAEQLAAEALESARRFTDADLELSRNQMGSSLVTMGRVAEGSRSCWTRRWPAHSAAEGGSLNTVVFTSCQMMISCSRAAQYERAGEWIRAADDFTGRYGCPFLYTVCRTLYGGVLFSTGSWAQAEEELMAALRMSTPAQRTFRGEALAKLAELRLAQGHIEEAERLVEGFDDHPAAAVAIGPSTSRGASRGRPRRFCADARAASRSGASRARAAGAAGRGRGRPGRDRRGRRQSQPARRAGRRPRLRRDHRPGPACPGTRAHRGRRCRGREAPPGEGPRGVLPARDAARGRSHPPRSRGHARRCRARRRGRGRPAALSPPSRISAPPIMRTRRRRSCARWG